MEIISNKEMAKYLKQGVVNSRGVEHICAFDIETSVIDNEAVIYLWQFCVDDCVTYGRDVHTMLNFLYGISNCKIVIYVHNLSYEYQFLRGWLHLKSVFARSPRKVLRFRYGRTEWRCSYLLTNKSLRKFLEETNVDNKKTELDYNIIRTPKSELTNEELEYALNDVVGLVQGLRVLLGRENDTLQSVPLTSTGYVRRDFFAAMDDSDRDLVNSMWIDNPELYDAAISAFAGGYVHANKAIRGLIIPDVRSEDRKSAYPAEMLQSEFPITPFERGVYKEGRCAILNISIEVTIKRPQCPYISLHKCRNILYAETDNGRIVSGKFDISVTDIDIQIIDTVYDILSMTINDCWISEYGKLPKYVHDVIDMYYTAKQTLRGVEGKEYEYIKSKNKLNSIYGMSASRQFYDNYQVGADGLISLVDEPYDYSVVKKRPAPYVWGIWVTALARKHLIDRICMYGDRFVYSDTDSVKFVGEIASIISNPQIGDFEEEQSYDEFVTWGAKKYAYVQGGKLGITVSGVSKSGADELRVIDNFRPGYVFKKSAGLTPTYNDNTSLRYVYYKREKISVKTNVALMPDSYTLEDADDRIISKLL